MQANQTIAYEQATQGLSHQKLLTREDKKRSPGEFIVATHGPALLRAVKEDPSILNNIGIYRVNCSHLGKESDLEALAKYLREIYKYVPILIDLQGPKPRIQEMAPEVNGGFIVNIGDRYEVTYCSDTDAERFCKPGKLHVCFPEIVDVMEIGDRIVFDDGKMMALVREKEPHKAIIECTHVLIGRSAYHLGGRKGICVRNKSLGIECITAHDRKSMEFARDILGYAWVDNIMVSYFSTLSDIEHFAQIIRKEYGFTGSLGAKFETPHAVANAKEILASNHIDLAMLGRGDLRVEMDPKAVHNMLDIQTYFFDICQSQGIESICATGYLESLLVEDGEVTHAEREDMITSVQSGADHLMLSGETTYGQQAARCIEIEVTHQRETQKHLLTGSLKYLQVPKTPIDELLYLLSSCPPRS